MSDIGIENLNLMEGLFGTVKKNDKESSFKDLFGTKEKDVDLKNYISDISISKVNPYPNHYFHMPDGEEWESFVESIKQHGVLQPIIVRNDPTAEDYYQIIAGHCRTAASKELGLENVPAIVIDVPDDVEASVLVGLTNKQREHITDIEWGHTYRETYELLKRKAGRPKENGSHDDHNYGLENGSHNDHNLKGKKTLEILAEKYGDSPKTIQRKIRLTYLISDLAELVIEKKIKQSIAIDLSYLSEVEQDYVYVLITDRHISITEDMAKTLKAGSIAAAKNDTQLEAKDIEHIISANTPEIKVNKADVKKVGIKVNKSVRKKYFPKEYDDSDIDNVITQLLDIWAKENNPEYEN